MMMANTVRGQELMEQMRDRREELQLIVDRTLTNHIDYVAMEKKLCLLKPGAEKLCDIYGYAVQFELVQNIGSHEPEVLGYIVKAILTDYKTGQVVAEGLGSANSRESHYQNTTPFDIANTVLKMAKKRAMVDAVLSAVGGSFLFTQDIEERQPAETRSESQRSYQNNKTTQNNQKNYNSSGKYNNNHRGSNQQSNPKNPATESQLSYIEKLVSKKSISVERLRRELDNRFGVVEYQRLSKQQASDFIKELKEW